MTELLSQNEANRLDQFNALDGVREVEQLGVTEILVAGHVASVEKVPLEAGAEDVDEEVETGEHLKDVVNGQKRLQLEGLAVFHQTATIILR